MRRSTGTPPQMPHRAGLPRVARPTRSQPGVIRPRPGIVHPHDGAFLLARTSSLRAPLTSRECTRIVSFDTCSGAHHCSSSWCSRHAAPTPRRRVITEFRISMASRISSSTPRDSHRRGHSAAITSRRDPARPTTIIFTTSTTRAHSVHRSFARKRGFCMDVSEPFLPDVGTNS
jgi:hypothetical protein